MSGKPLYLITVAAICVIASAIFAQSQNFVPDVTFTGSVLTGWHTLGEADWHADHGQISGAPKREGGGWLVLDHGYQDVEFSASVRCTGACKAGVLLRAEKTAQGMKGTYASLTDGDVAAYDVTLDVQGAEISRTKLAAGPGAMIRMATARFSGGEDPVPRIFQTSANPGRSSCRGREAWHSRSWRCGPGSWWTRAARR